MNPVHVIAAAVLGTLLVAEAVAPCFVEQRRDLRQLLRHDLRNLLVGGLNALIGAAFVAMVLIGIVEAADRYDFGLLRWLDLPAWAAWPVGFLLFDLWMYWWHRANHALPFLWRFHRMHHSDPAMDATSGVRFHPGEIILSGLARLVIVPLLGLSLAQLVAYEAVLLPVVLVHHANIRLPRWLDFGLFRIAGWGVVVSPAMHRVHHSQVRDETNSNYGSVLPWWDRLFGSLRVREDIENIHYGLPEFPGEGAQTLAGMLTTPLATAPAHEKADDP